MCGAGAGAVKAFSSLPFFGLCFNSKNQANGRSLLRIFKTTSVCGA